MLSLCTPCAIHMNPRVQTSGYWENHKQQAGLDGCVSLLKLYTGVSETGSQINSMLCEASHTHPLSCVPQIYTKWRRSSREHWVNLWPWAGGGTQDLSWWYLQRLLLVVTVSFFLSFTHSPCSSAPPWSAAAAELCLFVCLFVSKRNHALFHSPSH
jgi:hypothetical protein